ncbi:MAG: tRNA pseudouridine(38-40) synthase TruA [Chloroflexi bacterium]|nr:tRNA pseudouridine(38-40) synthase TruA [Chloroflexota bacterium]
MALPVVPQGTKKVVLLVEYDGANYKGFQWQSGVPTVQAELENAIFKTTQEKLRVLAASRTDTGVHAKGQMVSFNTMSRLAPATIVRALNFYLPEDIVVGKAFLASPDFNVQRDAISREYRYYILAGPEGSALWRNYSCPWPGELDLKAMNEACSLLTGEHDFISFTSKLEEHVTNTVRTVYRAGVRKRRPVVIFDITASSFLPHQIRHTASALMRVGLGKMTVDEFGRLLQARRAGIVINTAPAKGLYLIKVNYPANLEKFS